MEFRMLGPQFFGPSVMDPFESAAGLVGLARDEFEEVAKSVLVMVLHRPSEGLNAGYFNNAGPWAFYGTLFGAVADQWGGIMDITRCNMATTFLEIISSRPNVEYLCMMDADQNVPWDAPYRLARWKKGIVTGVVCSMHHQRGIYANILVEDDKGISRFPTFHKTKVIPGKGLREIRACGSGLVCIHKSVFEKILDSGEWPFKIPDEIRTDCCKNGVLKKSEDIYFCEQARNNGFKVFVDFSVRAVHYKVTPIDWPFDAVEHAMNPNDWNVAPGDYRHG